MFDNNPEAIAGEPPGFCGFLMRAVTWENYF